MSILASSFLDIKDCMCGCGEQHLDRGQLKLKTCHPYILGKPCVLYHITRCFIHVCIYEAKRRFESFEKMQ